MESAIAKYGAIDASVYPKVAAWWTALNALPAVKKARELDIKLFPWSVAITKMNRHSLCSFTLFLLFSSSQAKLAVSVTFSFRFGFFSPDHLYFAFHYSNCLFFELTNESWLKTPRLTHKNREKKEKERERESGGSDSCASTTLESAPRAKDSGNREAISLLRNDCVTWLPPKGVGEEKKEEKKRKQNGDNGPNSGSPRLRQKE